MSGNANSQFATEQGVTSIMGKQSAFGTAATLGRIVPLASGAKGLTHERGNVPNDARYQDGFKRESGLGNPVSGVELPEVPNFDYIGYPLFGFLGGFTDGAAVSGIYPHTGLPTRTLILHTFQEVMENNPGDFYQILDQVYDEYNFELSDQGLFKPTFHTVGSGVLVKSATSFDAAPVEITGSGPAEMLNWATAINSADEATVSKLSIKAKRNVLAVWVSTSTGMKCTDLIIGETTITGTMTALYKNDTWWARARAGTRFALDATITKVASAGTYSLQHLFPEMKISRSVGIEKQSNQANQQTFDIESFKDTNSFSPMKVVLKNATATHAT